MAVSTKAISNKEAVENINAAFDKGDTNAFLTWCADDVVWTMVGDKTVKGKEAIRQFIGEMPAEPPKFTVEAVVAEGDFVAAFGDMTMKEEGVVVPYSYCDVYRFKGGKVAELKSFVVKTNRER
jgi:uncharacterized protein (TIGR02246 family)